MYESSRALLLDRLDRPLSRTLGSTNIDFGKLTSGALEATSGGSSAKCGLVLLRRQIIRQKGGGQLGVQRTPRFVARQERKVRSDQDTALIQIESKRICQDCSGPQVASYRFEEKKVVLVEWISFGSRWVGVRSPPV